MEKTKKNFTKAFWLIILLLISNCPQVFAEEDAQPIRNMELLFVIDNSGSVVEEAESIMKTVELLQDWMKNEPLIYSVDYIAMDEKAQYVAYGDFPPTGQYTCIRDGVELADQWLEERLGDGKVKGIVFVTDLVESHRAVTGKVFDKAAEQESIDAILKRWENDYNEEMDYLFITWKVDDSLINLDQEFVCKISNAKLCNLKKDRENKAEESISQIEMTGTVMKKIVEILVGVELKEDYKISSIKRIKGKNWLYAFVILGNEAQLVIKGEPDNSRFLEVTFQTDSMQIYRLTEQDAEKDYQLQSDAKVIPYYLFYIPKEDLQVTFNHGLAIQEKEKFDIRCGFKSNDYRQRIAEEPLRFYFINQKTGDETEIILEEKKEEFVGSGVLEQAGTYNYEICSEGKEILKNGEIEVKEVKEDCGEKDKLSVKLIITVAILLSLVSITVAFIVIKRRKGVR